MATHTSMPYSISCPAHHYITLTNTTSQRRPDCIQGTHYTGNGSSVPPAGAPTSYVYDATDNCTRVTFTPGTVTTTLFGTTPGANITVVIS